ncbi:MAG: hypothetical protein EXQ47_12205 [Bryobacterales bacterium]|nr:hypothetical protein [Bryobacterales bacterium]
MLESREEPSFEIAKMTATELQRFARCQLADYDSRVPGTMFADGGGALTIEDAYRLQIETARLRSMRGEAIAGYKIGCVSPAVRRQLGLTDAVFGHVFQSEIRPNRSVLPNNEFDCLAIEGEIAVTLTEDVRDPEVLRDIPRQYVSAVFPIIELHNYVVRGPELHAVELIANNAFHAGIVVPETNKVGVGPEVLEISVAINGEQMGVASLDPFSTLYELAQLLRVFGISLRQGQIVLTGSPLPLYPVDEGDGISISCSTVGEVTAIVGRNGGAN